MDQPLSPSTGALPGRPFPPYVARLQRMVTTVHTLVYRMSGGAIGSTLLGCPVLLLTTIGRRSGRLRTAPLLYLADGPDLVIVASNGGAANDPTWWRNLEAWPRALVQIDGQQFPVHAEAALPAERERLWPLLVAMYPPYADYQARTPRPIPLITLHRSDDA